MDSHSAIVLGNARLRVWLDRATGRIMAVHNVPRDLDLVSAVLDTPPWRLEVQPEGRWIEGFASFSCSVDDGGSGGQRATLRWETEAGIAVISKVTVPVDEPAMFLTIAVENRSGLAIDKIEYPIVTGIGPLGARRLPTALVHSQGTGFLFRDPLATFLPEEGPRQGLRFSPYPEGFNGSTMQFMAYYAEERGGFYFATRDAGKAMKWYNFYKDISSGLLTASFMHQAPHVAPGLSFAPDYPVEISALFEGTWYEAAERYKAWAIRQPWTEQGPLSERAERPKWLHEDIGICTFGINAAHDRSEWLDAFHHAAGTPVFHILGPNWARSGQDYMGTLPGGAVSDWVPGRFSQANLETIRRNGDRWAPFEFDLLCSNSGSRPEPVLQCRQVLPAGKYSFDRYTFPFMCPATPFWHDLHVARDARIVAEHDPDAIYYDISLNNVLMACRSRHHPHHPGGGQEIADAYARMLADTKAEMARVAGRPVPMGTEMVAELVIPFVDFYQARAEASPASSFEADFWRKWLIEGKVEKIPLFAYVYHEYGPLRMDGWGKLSLELGDIFYWIASRVVLWGGLFELNYEFSPLEVLGGHPDDPAEHYYPFDRRDYGIDPEKLAFLAEVAHTRTGWARDYLAYGTMRRPPALNVAPVTLSYFLYNCGKGLPHYEERGTITVPGVICSAWSYGREKAAILMANLHADAQTVEILIEPRNYGLEGSQATRLCCIGRSGEVVLGRVAEAQTVSLSLPPRQIVGLEMRPE